MEAIRGPNNTFSFQWKCNKCESGKIIKSNSGSSTSNLKSHVSKFHLESISSFLTLRDCYKINSSSNIFKEDETVSILSLLVCVEAK